MTLSKFIKRNLNHKDRVKCTNNSHLLDKVFTIKKDGISEYLQLFQLPSSLLFTESGVCIQTSIGSLFQVGDFLEFYKSDSDY